MFCNEQVFMAELGDGTMKLESSESSVGIFLVNIDPEKFGSGGTLCGEMLDDLGTGCSGVKEGFVSSCWNALGTTIEGAIKVSTLLLVVLIIACEGCEIVGNRDGIN